MDFSELWQKVLTRQRKEPPEQKIWVMANPSATDIINDIRQYQQFQRNIFTPDGFSQYLKISKGGNIMQVLIQGVWRDIKSIELRLVDRRSRRYGVVMELDVPDWEMLQIKQHGAGVIVEELLLAQSEDQKLTEWSRNKLAYFNPYNRLVFYDDIELTDAEYDAAF